MRITVTTFTSDAFINLDVSPDLELLNFKELCSIECGIKSDQMIIVHDGKPLEQDSKPLSFYQIKDGDVLLAQHKAPSSSSSTAAAAAGRPGTNLLDFSTVKIPDEVFGGSESSSSRANPNSRRALDDPAVIREMYLSNPEELALLRHNNPMLAEAMESSLDDFKRVLDEQKRVREEQERLKIRLFNADPFDSEAQRLIQDEINKQNIASNMEAAMEYHPESFGSVHMLYINCKVNGHPVKAFIDSGAQSTIMSSSCAARCNVTRLIDTRWSGIAKGVGTQKITGRIHLGQIQIEGDFLASSFVILEGQEMDFLLGLDMLKRHQCCIDLKNNVLVIGTTGTKTTFLNENEIPRFGKFS